MFALVYYIDRLRKYLIRLKIKILFRLVIEYLHRNHGIERKLFFCDVLETESAVCF